MLTNADNPEQRGFWPGTVAGENPCLVVRGTVYGIALHGTWAERSAEDKAASPSAPVLFIKPKNTYLAHGGTVRVPRTLPEVEVSATVGVVFGRDVRRVSASEAFDHAAGLLLALDISEPGAGLFRPPIREKCRDGFLPIGPSVVGLDRIADLAALTVSLEVDGNDVASLLVGDTLDAIARSIEAVSSFMTLRAGDVLLIARSSQPVRAGVGSRLAAGSQELGRLECSLAFEEEVSA